MTRKSKTRRSKSRVPAIRDRAHLRGTKYALAYMLVAEGELSDVQIAESLQVDLSALQEAKSKLYFQQRVESIRRTNSILRAHQLPFRSTSEMLGRSPVFQKSADLAGPN